MRHYTMVGNGISLQKIPRNRLGTVSVIPRKKVIIPRHSESLRKSLFRRSERNKTVKKMFYNKKKCFTKKIMLQQTELRAFFFRPQNASERKS